MKRFLRPMIVLIDKLKYPEKFTVIALLVLIFAGSVLTPYVQELHDKREALDEGIDGIEMISDVRDLIEELQTQRGLMQVHYQNPAAAEDYLSARKRMLSYLREIDDHWLETISDYGVLNEWLYIYNDLHRLYDERQGELEAPFQLFEEQSALIQQLINLIHLVKNQTLYAIETDIESTVLINEMTNTILRGAETSARLRGMVSGQMAHGIAPDVYEDEIRVQKGVINNLRETYIYGNSVIFASFLTHEDLHKYFSENQDSLNELFLHIGSFLADGTIGAGAGDFFAESTESVDSYYSIFDEIIPLIETDLAERSAAVDRSLLFSFGAFGFVMLGLLYVFAGFYYSVVRTVSELSSTSEQVAAGDFTVRAALNTNDEMQTIGTTFNHMIGQVDGLFSENLSVLRDLQSSEQRFKSLFDYNPELVARFDKEGKVQELNPAFQKRIGLDVETGSDLSVFEKYISREDRINAGRCFYRSFQGETVEYMLKVVNRRGELLHLDVMNVPIIENGEVTGLFWLAKDVTSEYERENREKQVRKRTQQQNETILALSLSSNWDSETMIDEIVHSVSNVLHRERTTVWLEGADGFRLETLYDPYSTVSEKGLHVPENELRKLRDDFLRGLNIQLENVDEIIRTQPVAGQYFDANGIKAALITPVHTKGEVRGAVISESRIDGKVWEKDEERFVQSAAQLIATALERQATREREKEVHKMAFFDELTGLPNRRHFQQKLEKELTANQDEETTKAVLCLDLDMFKHINDTWGHSAGDELLQVVTARLQQESGEGVFVSRFGGDEFMLIISPARSDKGVYEQVEHLKQLFDKPFKLGDADVYTTSSMGVSLFPGDSSDAEELIKNADMAMYEAKKNGRNKYVFFHQTLYESRLKRIELEGDLRRAVANSELQLHYQPQVNLQTGELSGAEALARWHHPKLGEISPQDFIPLAEDTGLIIPLGNGLIYEACRSQRQFLDWNLPPVPLSVNVSVIQLMDERIVDEFRTNLARFHLDPSLIWLEVTESISAAHFDTIKNCLEKIRQIGVKVSIDDFGTGHSSLSYLKSFPVDVLKIDRSFIETIHESEENQAIVRSIFEMAKGLKLTVIAEGIETSAQLTWIRHEQTIYGQGYYFSKPLSAENYRDYVHHNHFLNT
ncbi:PAS domain S-box-containing protein/diguanylate cyclase (GGDEF)-like protein [Salisediminibacterium halotolerans]|nr:PAS domain S-box-containing protein/diguanylate cyclase (GGDEF)-like protein [Actinophytocola xinjiangensis]RPE86892.1 PAS domain S-box-containing protein/diguanylate cyclase (GGDEF)-like protein [Salisediminibacterium halotolerans]TWG32955.1 PAS domain S-box-containing protein/diguanylate cyclase (GGDEF)-like protein [Salisediminibacterium halotolerans]